MKIPVYVHAQYDEFEKVYTFRVWSHDMSDSQYGGVLVEKQEIDFTPPPHEVMAEGTIKQYRAQQQRIRAEAERNFNELQQRINDLLCIEFKPETVESDD